MDMGGVSCIVQSTTLLFLSTGADCHAVDIRGKCPFDYVDDHEEWIESGHFPDDIRALLKGWSGM